MLSNRILAFYKQLKIEKTLQKGIEVMNPYQDEYTFSLCEKFYRKYYDDERPRTLLLGINPGRFGSGMTGISFTDPIKLEKECGISNTLPKKPELSADFIYKMIAAFGGPEQFYDYYFVSAISPLGFTKNGKNVNYYDDKKLQNAVTPFIIDSIRKMLAMGIDAKKCYCIGEEKNFEFLQKLNQEQTWFKEIIPLSHPRFIMQYRRKRVSSFIDDYLAKLAL